MSDVHTGPIESVPKMPSYQKSRTISQVAEDLYRISYGERNKISDHIKATGKDQQWHFSREGMKYIIKYPKNRTVFVSGNELSGWAFHYEIQLNWFDCGHGRCFNGPLRNMNTWEVKNG